jgi:hypothetical protein
VRFQISRPSVRPGQGSWFLSFSTVTDAARLLSTFFPDWLSLFPDGLSPYVTRSSRDDPLYNEAEATTGGDGEKDAALRSRWRTGDRRCLPRKGSTGISDWLTVIIGDNWLDGHSSVVIGGYLALPSSRQVGRHSMIWPPFCRQIELVSICAYLRELDTRRALDAPDWKRMRGSALRVWRAQSLPSRQSWPALGAAERRRGAASTGGRCSTSG